MQTTLRELPSPGSGPDEPVDLPTFQAHARIDFDADEAGQSACIVAARVWLEAYLGRAIVRRALRYSIATRPGAGGGAGQLVPLLAIPIGFGGVMPLDAIAGGGQPIELPRAPARRILAVRFADADGGPGIVDADGWRADLEMEPATIRLLLGALPSRPSRVSIDFEAGYDADMPVPRPIVHAVLMAATYLYENRGDTEGAEMPAVVHRLADPYRIWSFG